MWECLNLFAAYRSFCQNLVTAGGLLVILVLEIDVPYFEDFERRVEPVTEFRIEKNTEQSKRARFTEIYIAHVNFFLTSVFVFIEAPRVAQTDIHFPLAVVCKGCPPVKNATHKVRIKDEIMTHSTGGERKINMKFYTLNSIPRTGGKSCISVIYNFVYPTNEVRRCSCPP